MAGRGREILLRIVGDGDDAKRKLAEVTTDLREFGQLNAEARADIKTQGAEAKLQVLRDRLFRLGQQEANPKVQIKMASTLAQIEVLEAKLEKLDHKSVNVDVDVRRGGAERAGAVFGALVGVLGSVGRVAAGVVGSFGNVGSSFVALTGRGAAFLPILALIVVGLGALAASALSAIVGLGALAIAFGAVLAPVALLAVVALPRLVAIFKALHEQHTKSAQGAQQVAAAHDQVVSATQAVADAQDNLRQQTAAANRAWRDSLEAVKDDLLDIQHAQLGIEQADLRRDQARLRLRQLLRESGVDQGQVQGLTQKAQDINFQQDPGALAKLLRGAGATDVGREKQLEIRQALLDVKDATLGVKDANDRLHDSHVKLADDERTRADFAKRGIAAYEPYRQATKQLATANRQLASAQRAQAAATVAQGGAMANLSPSERKFAAVIERIQKRIKTAFGPALNALFGGLGRGLDAATKSLTDPKVIDALTALGRAVGETFAAFGRELARPETRDAFVELARGAADLMRELGKKAAIDAFRLLLRVARAALPDLIDMARRFVGWLDGLEKGSRNSRKLRRDIKDAIAEAKRWIDAIIGIVNAVKDFLDFSRTTWRTVKRIVGDAIDVIAAAVDTQVNTWKKFGTAIGNGIKSGVRGVVGFVKGVINTVIDLVNGVTGRINDVTPGTIKILGKTITPGIPDIPTIPHLAAGGIALRDTLARIGEAGREAVIPLRADVLSALGQAIAVATPQMALAGAGLTPAGAGTRIDQFHAHITTPSGGSPDEEMLGVNLEKVMKRRGRG